MKNLIKNIIKEYYRNNFDNINQKFGKKFISFLFDKLNNKYVVDIIDNDILIKNKDNGNPVSITDPTYYLIDVLGLEEDDIDDAMDIINAWLETK